MNQSNILPMLEAPQNYPIGFSGLITDVWLERNVLNLKMTVTHRTHDVSSDLFSISLEDKFDFRRLMNDVGVMCFNGNQLDFNRLKNKKVILTYLVGYGYSGEYTNFHNLIVMSDFVSVNRDIAESEGQ